MSDASLHQTQYYWTTIFLGGLRKALESPPSAKRDKCTECAFTQGYADGPWSVNLCIPELNKLSRNKVIIASSVSES